MRASSYGDHDQETELEMSRENDQYVLIVACGHSGTTLLDMIVGSHSQAVSLNEVIRFPWYMSENRRCTCGVGLQECDFWRAVSDHLGAMDRSFDIGIGMGYVSGMGQRLKTLAEYALCVFSSPKLMRSVVRFFNDSRIANTQSVYDAANHVGGTSVAVESSKSPFRAKLLYLHRPRRVKLIHLVRDGRGTAASLMRAYSYSAWQASLFVIFRVKQWLTARLCLLTVPQSHKLLVRYEDLTADPRREIGRVCRFLGVPYEESMLDFRSAEHHGISGNRMRFRGEGIYHRPRSWENRLTERDLRVLEWIGGSINRRLGYE